jgi:hypothetical protein
MPDTPLEIFDELIWRSNPYLFDCEHHAMQVAWDKYRETGERPEERYLPGGMIKSLTPAQREILSKLTSDEVSKMRNPHTYYPKKNK